MLGSGKEVVDSESNSG